MPCAFALVRYALSTSMVKALQRECEFELLSTLRSCTSYPFVRDHAFLVQKRLDLGWRCNQSTSRTSP